MKTKIAIITLALVMSACSHKDDANKAADTAKAEVASVVTEQKNAAPPVNAEPHKAAEATPSLTTEADWNAMPDLKDIGNFPFLTAPQGLKIENVENGASQIFEFEKIENLIGNSIYTTEGKLAISHFDGDGTDFNQRLFDRSIYDYLDKMGAKQLFKGDYPKNEPQNEAARAKLKDNQWNGKRRFYGFVDDSPFAVYAFKNNGKNYMVNVQSNSAQGEVYVMELKAFEQTMKKYTAEGMKKELDAAGKAILNINFDTDKATLKPDGQTVVDEILALLNENPTLNISIEGYTDNTGAADHNKKLSADRANTVMYALAGKGIDISRLKSAGFGADKPLAANDTDDNKAKNRRVELVKF
ncbi:MAG: OmpA family protein [Methylotenera sp.]